MRDRRASVRSVAERDALVAANTRLVWHTLRIVARQAGTPSLSRDEDLFQDGMTGLIRAAELYDPAHGTQFSTYACRAIFDRIMRGLEARDLIRLPSHVRGEARREARERLKPRRLDVTYKPPGGGSWTRNDDEHRVARLAAREEAGPGGGTRYDLARVLARCRTGQERAVIEARARGETLEEVGRKLGICKERVRQIQVAAVARLRRAAEDGVNFEAG